MKPLRSIITTACVVVSFVINAGEELAANGKGATNQPTNMDLQLLQGTWEGVDLGDQKTPNNPDPHEASKRKPGEVDLDFSTIGVFGGAHGAKAPTQTRGKITITITGNSFHFHRDTNFWFETTITLPPGTNPKQLHATIKDCPTASSIGHVVFAIFKIEDGTLKIATEAAEGTRKSFKATGNGGLSSYELRKVQPQKKNSKSLKTQ